MPTLGLAVWAFLGIGCGPKSGEKIPSYRNDLSTMKTAQVTIKEKTFNVWLALNDEQRQRGLMQVTQAELEAPAEGPVPGMLFAFPDEQYLSFWMYNTITPLDIAFISADGRIVKIHTMAPLETRLYPSIEPAQYALEVLAGTFERLQIAAGDPVEIPESVLKDVR